MKVNHILVGYIEAKEAHDIWGSGLEYRIFCIALAYYNVPSQPVLYEVGEHIVLSVSFKKDEIEAVIELFIDSLVRVDEHQLKSPEINDMKIIIDGDRLREAA